MTSADFEKFYAAVHAGKNPFPWQTRLAERVLNGGAWPSVISLPTASGKTSVIDVAVFSLAAQAGRPALERTAPLRIFFVVDRRLVVDDATRHAVALAKALQDDPSPAVAEVRQALLRFGARNPLEVAALRGGMFRNDTWADAPNQPLVCVSTVDQVGSRLLFRGYGVSDSSRPIQAGLIGNDSLLIVDEAHLSKPFLDTLDWIRKYQAAPSAAAAPSRGVQLVQMSATVRNREEAFQLDTEDVNSALQQRLKARKSAQLLEAADLERTAMESARRLAKDEHARVVGVVLNTVRSARKVFETIEAQPGEKILLTGRVRPYDRDRLLDSYRDRMQTGRDRSSARPLFVVATQTIEVGADLDFDALVTEAAPLDALRQRFGRLDRIGELQSTQAVIIKPKRGDDRLSIYGEALETTWKWLLDHAEDLAGAKVVDFGVQKMSDLYAAHGSPALNSSAKDGPILFPAHLEAWVQTNPSPTPEPDVAPFLHGADALNAPDVQIVWRADLKGVARQEWPDLLSMAPPTLAEALPLPIGAARRWLRQRAAGTSDSADVPDIEGAGVAAEEPARGQWRPFIIWRGPYSTRWQDREVRPGCTVVLPCAQGGCDEFGWNPDSSQAVTDIGDLCASRRAAAAGGRFRIRIHPEVAFPDNPENRKALSELMNRVLGDDEDASAELREFIEEAAQDNPDLLAASNQVDWRRIEAYSGGTGLLVSSKWQRPSAVPVTHEIEPEETDENDEASLARTTRTITLSDHIAGVVAQTRQFAAGCGLRPELVGDLVLAAELHDLGKWDDRFQMLLDSRRDLSLEPLAKGQEARSAREYFRRRDLAEYPAGARHEFTSLAVAAAAGLVQKAHDPELVRHLVGTHHGCGRVLPPVWPDTAFRVRARINGTLIDSGDGSGFAQLDSGWIEQFWALVERYGPWGLAYLEAILRRADCVRSREEQKNRRKPNDLD